ncbi:hypothetical protein BGX38DRAFT_1177564 [Terfezia claveryi]|nr:hypothetical protein BGX38DRAFT_1177564 [Terfezia claveryi]
MTLQGTPGSNEVEVGSLGHILPEFIPEDGHYSIDTAPVNRWDLNVLTPQGEESLRNVATHVKTMCAGTQICQSMLV